MSKGHIGSSFDSFLEEEGIREEVELLAQKQVFANRVLVLMQQGGVTRTQLAKQMGTSRMALHRLLDAEDTGVTLETMVRAARALGVTLAEVLGLAPLPRARRPKSAPVAPATPTARTKQVRARGASAAPAAYRSGAKAHAAPTRRTSARSPER